MINAESVALLADGLKTCWAPFPRAAFVSAATTGLGGLELKDRVRHVSSALHEALPFPRAAEILRETVNRVRLDMWSGWPATDHVGRHGLDHLDEAMATLAVLTTRDGSRRVFHLGERTATVPGQTFTMTKSHSFRPVTTRSEPPGPRLLEIVVNGVARASAPFTLIEA